MSGIGYRLIATVSIIVRVLPLYSHAILVYCSTGPVLSRPFSSPANMTRQLASLFAAATADREALPSCCAYCSPDVMQHHHITVSWHHVMTSRRTVSVSILTRLCYCGIGYRRHRRYRPNTSKNLNSLSKLWQVLPCIHFAYLHEWHLVTCIL